MKKERILIYALLGLLFVSLPTLAVFADDVDTVSDNSISDNDVLDNDVDFEINSVDDFMDFANGCKRDSYSSGVVFRLNEDIDLTGTDFAGVPYFNGTFYGQGHTITFASLEISGSNQGFIRYIGPNGIVRELNIIGSIEVKGSQNAIGGLVGVNNGIVSKCSFSGSINGEDNVGGVCGINKDGAVLNECTNNASVLATNYTGGICGRNEGTITFCTNNGKVNTEEMDASLDLGAVDVGALNISQNVMNRNDVGGIAGYSSGVIRLCKNNGEIGYIHTGYNVGGIVGRQDGTVTICTNYGPVYGRKDVGGIVGQAEPFIESDYLSDKVDKTREDLNNLNDTISGISSSISNTSAETKRYADELNNQYKETLETVSSNIAEITTSVSEAHPEAQEYVDNINEAMANIDRLTEAKNYLEGVDLNKYRDENGKLPKDIPDDIKKYVTDGMLDGGDINGAVSSGVLAEIQANMDIVNDNLDQVYQLYDDKGASSDEFLQNVSDEISKSKTAETIDDMITTIDNGTRQVINGFDSALKQTNDMVNNVSSDLDYLLNDDNNYIEDISSVQTATDMDGVVSFCVNKGVIEGDINAGGIAGIMNIEYDLDPEYDLDMTETLNVKVRSTVNNVIIRSLNYGKVTSKKDYAGGVTGHQELGLIFDCESYGAIKASDGDMIGGIAGYSAATILKSYSFCRLEGNNSIGGIVGQGYTVQECVAICNIISDGECIGAVAGVIEEEGNVKSNLFVSDVLEGIDGISYAGIAEPIDYDTLMNNREVPMGFRMVTVDFVADDVCISQVMVRYGEVINDAQIPSAPDKDGYYVKWNMESTESGIYNNIVIEAEYIPWRKSIASEQIYTIDNENGVTVKPVFLVSGKYYDDTIIYMESVDYPPLSENDIALYAYDWKLISESGIPSDANMVEGRFYAAGYENNAKLYIKYNDTWQQVSTKIDGGYLVAVVPMNGEFAMVVSKTEYRYINTYIALAICAILVVVLILVKKKKGHDKNSINNADNNNDSKRADE